MTDSNERRGGAKTSERPHWEGHRLRLLRRFQEQRGAGWPDYELVELLLTYAIPRRDVKPLAKTLMEKFGNLPSLLDADPARLREAGLTERAATLFPIARSLLRRYFEVQLPERDLLSSPEAVVRFCQAELAGEPNEVISALYLDTKNRLLGTVRLSEGTIDRSPLFPRRVVEAAEEARASAALRGALSARAKGVILVHNHPSGDVTPSPEDRALTEAVQQALVPVGLVLHDHLIVSRTAHVSFRERGWMQPTAPVTPPIALERKPG